MRVCHRCAVGSREGGTGRHIGRGETGSCGNRMDPSVSSDSRWGSLLRSGRGLDEMKAPDGRTLNSKEEPVPRMSWPTAGVSWASSCPALTPSDTPSLCYLVLSLQQGLRFWYGLFGGMVYTEMGYKQERLSCTTSQVEHSTLSWPYLGSGGKI